MHIYHGALTMTPISTLWYAFSGGLPHMSHVNKGCVTVYPKKYAHGFVMLCFVVVMQSFIMNSHEVFIHIHQGCFAGTGAIVRLPQCQWSKPDGYGKISQCITTTKHSKAKTVCIFLGIYCINTLDTGISGCHLKTNNYRYSFIGRYRLMIVHLDECNGASQMMSNWFR